MSALFNKKQKFTLAAVAVSLCGCLIIGEIGIRLYHLSNGRQRFVWRPDRFLGYVHTPRNAFEHRYTEEERVTVQHRTNAFGFIGDDIKVKKEEGTYRVLVLGDSFTEAIQAPDDDNFCARLQNLLNGLPGRNFQKAEVINAGVSGYSPLNYYLVYERELSRFEPDLILVQIFANDVFEDNEATAKSLLDENGLPLLTNRYFSEKYWEHPPVERKTFNGNPLGYRVQRFLTDHSRLFEYFYVKFYNMRKASAFHQEKTRENQFGTGWQFFILDPDHVLSKDEAFREKAWGQTQKYLSALNAQADRHHARLMLFYMPMEVQLDLDHYGEHVSQYIQQRMGTYFNDLLGGFAARNNIPFHDLLEDFESNKSEGLYLSRDGHLTPAGHQVVARSLFRYIIQNSLLQ